MTSLVFRVILTPSPLSLYVPPFFVGLPIIFSNITHFSSLFRVLHPKPSLVGNHIVFSSESKLLLLLLKYNLT